MDKNTFERELQDIERRLLLAASENIGKGRTEEFNHTATKWFKWAADEVERARNSMLKAYTFLAVDAPNDEA